MDSINLQWIYKIRYEFINKQQIYKSTMDLQLYICNNLPDSSNMT